MENSKIDEKYEIKSWYFLSGENEDVVLSSRSRIYRNLADFPFLPKMNEDDSTRIKSIIYDCVSNFSDFDEIYQFTDSQFLSDLETKILQEKNIFSQKGDFSICLNEDDGLSCLINETEHIKIACFSSGLQLEKTMEKIYELDAKFQEKMQFAANIDFGYLTSNIQNCGTSLKNSIRVFMPSLFLENNIENFNVFIDKPMRRGFYFRKVFPTSQNILLQSIFDVFYANDFLQTEFEHMASLKAFGLSLVQFERKNFFKVADNIPTVLCDILKKQYSKVSDSFFLTYEEVVQIVCAVKIGINIQILKTITHTQANSLLFRTKTGHLQYLCEKYDFNFEEDVMKNNELKIKRLRALIVQQTFEGNTKL